MTAPLSELYQEYIDCLNNRDWGSLANYLDRCRLQRRDRRR